MTFPDQPDYGAIAEDFDPPFMPTLIRDMWIYGDHHERRTVDRLLAAGRREQERAHWDMFRF